MKTHTTIILALLTVFFIGCKTEDLSLKKLDLIPADKYYSSDIVPEVYKTIYGTWKVTGTSGGFSGMGYTKDFDYLILKENGIFGILRNDSLIAYGKLNLLQTDPKIYINALYCGFEFEKSANIELNADKEKYFQLTGKDTLSLIAPCCDRFNTHLIRKQ